MAPNILLASQHQKKEALQSIVTKKASGLTVVDSMVKAEKAIVETQFQIAVIDENFDGLETGWLLAKKIKKYFDPDVKVIMLVEKSHRNYFDSGRNEFRENVDWVMVFPISEEQLLHELDRRSK